MHFSLLDRVIERTDSRLVSVKCVSGAEEYLLDHFPGFPVLPGVLMLEALVQAARELVDTRAPTRLVLGQVRALKYGRFVRPGEVLRVEVELLRQVEGGAFEFRGEGTAGPPGGAAETAVSGRFTLRPIHAQPARAASHAAGA